MELAHPPIIASKLQQTAIIHAVEGKRQRERVGGRKSSQGAWVPLMATRVVLVVMGDGSSPSHQSTLTLFLGLAGGLSQHKLCPCSSLAQQRPPTLAQCLCHWFTLALASLASGSWRSPQLLTISGGCLAGGVSPWSPHPRCPEMVIIVQQTMLEDAQTDCRHPATDINIWFLSLHHQSCIQWQVKRASTGPAVLCTLMPFLDCLWVCFTLEGSTVRASQFMDFSVWGLMQ